MALHERIQLKEEFQQKNDDLITKYVYFFEQDAGMLSMLKLS